MATRKRVYCRLRKRVTLISWEAERTEQQIGRALYATYYIRVARWLVTRLQSSPIGTNFAGYMFAKQSYWHKLRGLLFKFKAILLVQTAWAFFKLRRPRAFYWVHIDWPAPGHPMGAGNPTISGNRNRNPSPGPLPAPAPAAPHNKTYFSASKTNKKNNRHMNYRHW